MSADKPIKPDESNEEGDPQEEKSFLRIIVHSFFIIPFLIAVFCILLFAGVHLLTSEKRSVYDYLEDVKTGGSNKRWQGAFELSKILANPKLFPQDGRFSSEMIHVFEKSLHDDPRVRQYLALAMGRTQREEFAPALQSALADEPEVSVPALIYALGMLQAKNTAASIVPFVSHPKPRIRSIAVAALGNLSEKGTEGILKKALQDQEPNVQWGAAISLAQMGDLSGKNILLNLMDRTYLAQFKEVDMDEQKYLVLSAIKAAGPFQDSDLQDKFKELSQKDSSMKVRAAALENIQK